MTLFPRIKLSFNISVFELLFGQRPVAPGNLLGQILVFINTLILTTLGVLYAYQVVMSFASIFVRGKKYPEASLLPHYIFVTSARNEENVVAQLITSIRKLNYPQSQITIHVIADNCTDKTKEIAENLGVRVFVRDDLSAIGKSYALDYYFKAIKNEVMPEDFAGFIVVDTDNVFDVNYLQEINNVFVAKESEVIAAYRNSSNMGRSLATYGSGYSFLRECSLLHKVREHIGLSSYVSGTSFFVSKTKMDKLYGWPFHALIEDIEFSADHVNEGGVTNYAHEAIFYDEQPVTMGESLRQRLRWVKGLYQVFFRYAGKLFVKIFSGKKTFKERFRAFESFLFVIPLPAVTAFWFVIYGIFAAINLYFSKDVNFFLQTYAFSVFDFFFIFYVFTTIMSLIISFTNWKRIKMNAFKKIVLPFVGFFFLVTYIPLLLIAPFIKVKWSAIRHDGVKEEL